MSSQHVARENDDRLAGGSRKSRRNPVTVGAYAPPKPSLASLPDPITPDDLELAANASAVIGAATDRVVAASVAVNGQAIYNDRREGRDPLYQLGAWLVQQVNAGMNEAEFRMAETFLDALARRIYRGAMRRTLPDIKALETRYQGECDALMMDVDRRIASGEPEAPEMYDALARAWFVHAVHCIEGGTACQAKAAELRRASTVKANLRVER